MIVDVGTLVRATRPRQRRVGYVARHRSQPCGSFDRTPRRPFVRGDRAPEVAGFAMPLGRIAQLGRKNGAPKFSHTYPRTNAGPVLPVGGAEDLDPELHRRGIMATSPGSTLSSRVSVCIACPHSGRIAGHPSALLTPGRSSRCRRCKGGWSCRRAGRVAVAPKSPTTETKSLPSSEPAWGFIPAGFRLDGVVKGGSSRGRMTMR